MQIPEHYTSDILSFFDGKPLELSLYQALTVQMTKALPDDICIKVQKPKSVSITDGCSPLPPCRCAGKRTGPGIVW